MRFAVLFWMLAIFIGASLSLPLGSGGETSGFPVDKLLHFIAFFVLTLLFIFSYPQKSLKKALLLTFCYGLFIEVYQLFLPWRTFSLLDLSFDVLGGLFVVLPLRIFRKRE